MRMFWIAIGVLAIIAVIVVWRGESSGSSRDRGSGIAVQGSGAPSPSIAVEQSNRTTSPSAARGAGSPAVSPDAAVDLAVAPGNNALRAPGTAKADAPGLDVQTDEQDLADELMDSAEQNQNEDIDDALDDGTVPMPGNEDAGVAEWDGEIVDGKYIVAGEGTAENPYEVTWDLLVLAAQTYQPRQGRTDIPPQVDAVNGKHIKIAGYFTIPIASDDPKEVLFMLNMWDGCCIGMPPSPYDAIEVRLKEPMGDGNQFVNYATLTGTLSVDPYVQNGWLLGMYVMTDGKLDIGM